MMAITYGRNQVLPVIFIKCNCKVKPVKSLCDVRQYLPFIELRRRTSLIRISFLWSSKKGSFKWFEFLF